MLLCSIVSAFSGGAAEGKGCMKAFQNSLQLFVDFWGCLLTTLRGDAKQMQEVLLDRWCSAYVR